MLESSKIFPSMDLYGLLVDASIDRVMAIDMEWRIIAWNRTSEIITGIPQSSILGRPLIEVLPDIERDGEFLQALHMAMNGKKSFLFPNPDFQHRSFYETHIIPLENKDGTLIGVMHLMHDVSHRIKAELELQELHTALKNKYEQLEKANAELAIFTTITGKDLKEPFRKLYTGLELLVQTDGKKLSDNSKAGLRRMQASLTKMSLLLDDILAFSTTTSFDERFVPLELDNILQSALASLGEKIADKKAVIEATHLPAYNGSKEMLHYLFYNIIDNALKFQVSDNIPYIKITAEIVTVKGKLPKAGDQNLPFLCISFTDNGVGFPSEDKKRIFNMFERLHTRRQFAGAGIGLTISWKIAEAHGGFIEAESSLQTGTVFRCYLELRS